jgi:hypothetical protein
MGLMVTLARQDQRVQALPDLPDHREARATQVRQAQREQLARALLVQRGRKEVPETPGLLDRLDPLAQPGQGQPAQLGRRADLGPLVLLVPLDLR